MHRAYALFLGNKRRMDEQELFARFEEKTEPDCNDVGLRLCPLCKAQSGEFFLAWDATLNLIEKHFPAIREASDLWEKADASDEDDYDDEPFPETVIYVCPQCVAKIQKDLRPKSGSLIQVSD